MAFAHRVTSTRIANATRMRGANSNLGKHYVTITTDASGSDDDRDRARRALDRVVRRATPIMSTHGLKVSELREMTPPRAVTIWGDNLNSGARIRLVLRVRRVRRARKGAKRARKGRDIDGDYRWIDDDRVFAVFLHELAHNVRGPHDEKFYALLNQMTRQAELHMASDLYVCGRCVGDGALAREVGSPRRAAAAAALRRADCARPPSADAARAARAKRRSDVSAATAAADAAAARASAIVISDDDDEPIVVGD